MARPTRIERIETMLWSRWLLVRIYCEDGTIGIGEGAELQAPLARVVIGGLTASTLVTLVLVPAVYTVFEEGISGLRRGAAPSNPERA